VVFYVLWCISSGSNLVEDNRIGVGNSSGVVKVDEGFGRGDGIGGSDGAGGAAIGQCKLNDTYILEHCCKAAKNGKNNAEF